MRGPRINQVVICGRVEVSWSPAAPGWRSLLLRIGRRRDTELGPVRDVSQMVITVREERIGEDWDVAPGDRVMVTGKLGARRRALVIVATTLQRY